jgi:hypothetical protein
MIESKILRGVGHSKANLLIRGMVVGSLVVFMAAGVSSLPRLSVEHSLPCRTCHINPNGGGMRTEFGNQAVALNELCLQSTKEAVVAKAVKPRVAPSLLVGFDSRYLIFDDGSVLRMQSDVYADFTPFDQLHYAVRFGESGISESYGLIYFDEEHYYVKAGRFYPVFGLRDADHTAYVRSRTGHPPLMYLDGFSLGGDIRGVNLVLEGFRVGERGVFGAHIYGTRVLEPVSLMGGASLRLSEELNGSNGANPHAKALFAGVSWDRFTLMGETDLVGQSNDTLVTFANLTTRIIYGLYLVGEYNFFDPDRSTVGSVDEFVRVSAEFFPLPYVQLRPSYTYYTRGYLEKTDDYFMQLHLGF